jgi:osmoprotectant transport system substrate-binding protein
MSRIHRLLVLPLLALLTAIAIGACGGGAGDAGGSSAAIRVGSKNFAEQFVLGQMYALVLEENGFEVERKINLGGTQVAHESLVAGEIDLYPEYTGTGLLTILKLPTNSDPEEVYETVSEEYAERFDLVWLEPAPMNNTYALFMTPEDVQETGIKTISDLAEKGQGLTMIGTPEFQGREDGLSGLEKAYSNFQLEEYKAVDAGLRYRGLVNDQADIAVGFATDGEISAYNLVRIEDNKNFFPPYQVAPVVREGVLEENPEIREILNRLSEKITDETMQRLNYEVTGNQREPAEVAREFLSQEGLYNS